MQPTFVFGNEEDRGAPGPAVSDVGPIAVMGAVRDDLRQTLRVAWIDPAVEAMAAEPRFFTAAWSAVRPNVGKSFLILARRVRTEAVEGLRQGLVPSDLAARMSARLPVEERHRVEEIARAAHLASAKSQIVLHAFRRAALQERIPGTGREEASIRRGVPDWQRWMMPPPLEETGAEVLRSVTTELRSPSAPAAMHLLARWPAALTGLWEDLQPILGSDGWRAAGSRVRRVVLGGMGTLPHPVELQWSALRSRGFSEDDRAQVSKVAIAQDAAMSSHTLIAAFLWLATGAPDIGVES